MDALCMVQVETDMLMYLMFKIGVRSGILLSRDRAVHFIAQRNPDEIKYVKIPFSFY